MLGVGGKSTPVPVQMSGSQEWQSLHDICKLRNQA